MARLERDNRRYRVLAALATGLALAWTGCGIAFQEKHTLSAERFVLLAPDGSEGAALEYDSNGNPLLHMRKGDARVALTTNGPSLLLRGADGRTSAFLGISTRNASNLELSSSRLQDGVRLTVREDGSAGVYVLDAEGRQRGGLESFGASGAGVTFKDEMGRLRSSFGIDPTDLPNLILLDPRGGRRMGMLLQEDGNALLEIEDEKGLPRGRLTTDFDGSPRLELLREDGRPSFQAP
jgi:hypothetical protein